MFGLSGETGIAQRATSLGRSQWRSSRRSSRSPHSDGTPARIDPGLPLRRYAINLQEWRGVDRAGLRTCEMEDLDERYSDRRFVGR